MEEGTLAKWLVKVGDTVKAGDVIAEIETDKATMEVEAVDEGVVEALLVDGRNRRGEGQRADRAVVVEGRLRLPLVARIRSPARTSGAPAAEIKPPRIGGRRLRAGETPAEPTSRRVDPELPAGKSTT